MKRTIIFILLLAISICPMLASCGGGAGGLGGESTGEQSGSNAATEAQTDALTDTQTDEVTHALTDPNTEAVSTEAKRNPKLPSMPEELWDHVYLTGRSNGNCLSLTGRAALLCVFVNDESSVWTEEAKAEAMKEFERGAEMIKSEAARYGAEAEPVLTYCEGTVEYPDSNWWLDLLLEDIGYKSESWAREKVARDAEAASSAVVVCYNDPERSYAYQAQTSTSVERAMLFERDAFTFAHEILHMFGAVDYYFPEETEKAARSILGESIMNDDVAVIDSLTAYLVGWTDVPSEEALEFLRETADLTAEYLAEKDEEQSLTGHVESYVTESGVYTGELLRGVFEGKGRLVFNSGAVYEGDFVYGSMHGVGKLTYPDGSSYEGDWKEGKMTGVGKLTFKSGTVYEGDVVDGKMHGYGKYTDAEGNVYDGEWNDGKMHGQGQLTLADGTVITGTWENGTRVN